MIIAFWSFYEENCRDMKMFHEPDSPIANGIFRKWNTLYDECEKNGISIISLDQIEDLGAVDIIVFADFPRTDNPIVRKALNSNKPKILIIEEGPLIYPGNWNIKNHKLFNYIFTWNDDFVDNIKYFKFNVHYITKLEDPYRKKETLCVMVARNKRAFGKSELYSERRKIIRFFEKDHPTDFDLYGEGWDIFYFPSNVPFLRLLNGSKMFWMRSKIKECFPSWKGTIHNKIELLKEYRFSIVFENAIGPTGYISEKIWDSFAAGTVPVYFGAPNIQDHIPANCFIDYRKFSSPEALYSFMKLMSNDTYNEYLGNIKRFLEEESNGGQFSDGYFVKSFISLLHDISIRPSDVC